MIGFEFRRIALAQGCLPVPPTAQAGEEPETGPHGSERDEAGLARQMIAARAGQRDPALPDGDPG